MAVVACAVGVTGCAATMERNGIADARLADTAHVVHMPDVRFWGDAVPKNVISEVRRRLPNMPAIAQDATRVKGRPLVETLALSGGGSDGAFGAGVLAGWTQHGDRPEFEIVTGVSAGAIIAPFAYLGPHYDRQLKEIWTEYQMNEIAVTQILPGLFGGPALADTSPMAALIAKYIDMEFLRQVAAEYSRGRMLLVLTTNLDAQRPVVWNMGEIARSGTTEALDLFRSVIMASAAIPGAFPPVSIAVEANGKLYEELHVDGGTTRETFVLPVQAPFKAFDALYPAPPVRRLFLIKNGKINPESIVVEAKTLSIATRAIATLIKSQNWGELYRIYRLAKDAVADFNLLAVPPEFTMTAKNIVDPAYQKALYDLGYKTGAGGGPWMKAPPGQSPIR
ncbi:MAG: patatin-like phospholipase family protein [Hyphomicrobium sp.]